METVKNSEGRRQIGFAHHENWCELVLEGAEFGTKIVG
jgi:hypothetical protein